MHKDVDTLLKIHFHRQPDYKRLNGLEQAVWQRIKAQQRVGWFDELFSAFTIPQFRLASIGLALLIGLAASIALPPMKPTNAALASVNAKGLNVFAMNAAYLPSTMLENASHENRE